MTRSEFSSGSKAPRLSSLATCISNDLVRSGLWVACTGSLLNCSEPSGAKCPARTHNDMEAQAAAGLGHYPSRQLAFIGLSQCADSAGPSRCWPCGHLACTGFTQLTDTKQVALLDQWVKCFYPTSPNQTLSPSVPRVLILRL